MAMATALPYGIRDIKLRAFKDAAGTTLDTKIVDLPNARTLSFSEEEDFEELRGDDRVVTTHGKGAQVSFEFESGGLPLEAVQLMNGGTITESGVAPNSVKTYDKTGSSMRPFFQITGRAISDSGGDLHCILYRCKLNDKLEGEFSDGEFFLLSGGGVAIPMIGAEGEDKLYSFIQNETSTPLPETAV